MNASEIRKALVGYVPERSTHLIDLYVDDTISYSGFDEDTPQGIILEDFALYVSQL